MHDSGNRRAVGDIEAVLLDGHFERQIDMVISSPAPNRYRVAAPGGSSEFARSSRTDIERNDNGAGSQVDRPVYAADSVVGVDPLADTATDRFVGLTDELAHPFPTRDINAYPHAQDQIAQFFDSPHAPDLVVQHTPGHHFDSNLGEHGSLGIVAARAPFIASGAGVPRQGTVAQSARMVDIAPTVLSLLGGTAHPAGIGPLGTPRPEGLLARQDGDVLAHIVDPGEAHHVVVVLLDGCNSNALYHAISTGLAPAIASLADAGTTLLHGLMASLPTATLANHTTASTGAHPGHSGVLHNMWLDRRRKVTPDLLAMDQMFDAMAHLHPDIETVHQALHRSRPEAFTAAIFEFCDTGADFSSFAGFRGGRPPALPDPAGLADASSEFIGASAAYSFMSSVDECATRQAIGLWERAEGNPLPDFTFLSLALTDEAGHESGPHSEMARAAIADCDRRIARLADAVDRSGARRNTAFVILADHGMEANDPTNNRPWDDLMSALTSELPDENLVDVAQGLIYRNGT